MPGLVKIGKTARDPNSRAGELHQTGVPTPFVVEYFALSPNCDDLERGIHDEMGPHRVAPDREFFLSTVSDAIECLDIELRVQIRAMVERYLPEFDLSPIDYSVTENEIIDLARDLNEHPVLVADALATISAEELQPSLDRIRARIRKTEEKYRRKTALVVVKS